MRFTVKRIKLTILRFVLCLIVIAKIMLYIAPKGAVKKVPFIKNTVISTP